MATVPLNQSGRKALTTIVGVDPGSRITGFAVIRARKSHPLTPRDYEIVDAGVLRVPDGPTYAERLGLLHDAMHSLLERHKPEFFVLERAFYDKNAATALRLGELRGAYIAASSRHGIPTHEITPAEVKKTITGNGRAEKSMVSLAVEALTGFKRGDLPHDVTDALAISICFALANRINLK